MELLSPAQGIEKQYRLLVLHLSGDMFYPRLQIQYGLEDLDVGLPGLVSTR
jgi:hypothetical protein